MNRAEENLNANTDEQYASSIRPLKKNNVRMKKIVFGLLLVLAGVLLMGFKLGLLDYTFQPIVFSWQMLLVAIGFINLFGKDKAVGVILMGVGGFFLLPYVYLITFNPLELFWPVVLVAIGLVVVFKKKREKTCQPKVSPVVFLGEGYIQQDNVFSGKKIRVEEPAFKGGTINNVFGGCEIDLRQSVLAEGKNTLHVECVFGGVVLLVPAQWKIKVEVSSVMGGFVDKRPSYITSDTSGNELIIKGNMVFGGGEIKSI